MSRLASQTDFFATYDLNQNKVPGTGVMYDNYQRFPFFAERANIIASRFATNVGKIIVFGCGFGYLVDELVQRGYDAWGCDLSDYARNKAAEVLPFASANRIILADMGSSQGLNAVRNAAGLTGNQRFAVGISEDILPVCTDDNEVRVALASGHGIVSTTAGRILHWITCSKPENANDLNTRMPGLLWKSRTEWGTLIRTKVGQFNGFPTDVCFDAEGNIEF